MLSRLSFADKATYQKETSDLTDADKPYCAKCPVAPVPPQGFDMAGYLFVLDEQRVLPPELYEHIRDLSVFNA